MLTTSSHRRVLTKRLLMLPLALLTSAMGCAQHWTPDAATIHKVESDIQTSDIPLPYSSGHRPVIAQYARYYSAYRANGHRMITGELVLPSGTKMKPAGIYMVVSKVQFPTIFDGGCAVMNVVYDVDAGHVVSLKCNGFA